MEINNSNLHTQKINNQHKPIYKFIALILLISLFLQSCNNSNPSSPNPGEKDTTQKSILQIDSQPILDQELIPEGGSSVNLHHEEQIQPEVIVKAESLSTSYMLDEEAQKLKIEKKASDFMGEGEEDERLNDEQINQYKLDKLEEFRTLIMLIITTGSEGIKSTSSYKEWEKSAKKRLARKKVNQRYKEWEKFLKRKYIEEEWAKAILLEQDLVKQEIIGITLSGVKSYGKPKILTKPTIESDALPIFREPIITEISLQESYPIDSKIFRRQNVSGYRMRCFFNSTGLKAEEQIYKLRKYQNDPVVRYMIANEIVSAAKTPEQLPDEIKKAINYELYEQQIEPINAEKVRVEGMRLLTTEELQNLNKQEEAILEEIRQRACIVEAFNAFLDYHIGNLQMMVANRDVKGDDPENKDPNYTSIDAIAYINNLGIKIYQPAQIKDLDGNTRIVKGELDLIHEFFPAKATRVAYLYHADVHFQTLIPVEQDTSLESINSILIQEPKIHSTTQKINQSNAVLASLPPEIWQHILSYVKFSELLLARLVNSNFKQHVDNNSELRRLIETNILWARIVNLLSNELWIKILSYIPNSQIKSVRKLNSFFYTFLETVLQQRLRNVLKEKNITFKYKCKEIDRLIELGLYPDPDICNYYGHKLGGITVNMEPCTHYNPWTEEEEEDVNIDEIGDEVHEHLETRTGYHRLRPTLIFSGINAIIKPPPDDYRILDPEEFSSLEDYDKFKKSTFNEQRNIFKQLKIKNPKVGINPDDIPQYLCWAAEKGNIELANRLLEMGANINIKVKDGQTLLHIAVKRRQLEFIKWLLDLGAKINAKDNRGNTPLHIACVEGNLQGIDYEQGINLLLERGAILFIKNNNRKTPIDLAYGRHYAMLKNKENAIWNKLYKLAQNYKRLLDLVDLLQLLDLLHYPKNIYVHDHQGETLLHRAIETGDIEIIKILIQLGADINALDDHGNTPLGLAIWIGNQEIIKLLRENISVPIPIQTDPNLVIDLAELSSSEDEVAEQDDRELPDLVSDSED